MDNVSFTHEMDDIMENTWNEIFGRMNRKEGEVCGIATGLKSLDMSDSGWQPGRLYVLAGRPGEGKTAMMLFFAREAVKQGRRTYVVSLEMGHRELGERILAGEGTVDIAKLKHGSFSESEMAEVVALKDRLKNLPLVVDDSSDPNIDSICSRVRDYNKERKIDLLAVDYVQLLSSSRNIDNRAAEIGECTRKLKLLAKELGCPVILLGQLNRSAEDRTCKSGPTMSNLKDSGSIEQDADMVMIVMKEDGLMVNPVAAADGGVAPAATDGMGHVGVIKIAKQRNGGTGKVYFRHNGSYTQVVECGLSELVFGKDEKKRKKQELIYS